jgi:NAD(P) transhydrogenase subunit alpha
MRIAVPKETTPGERRVALVPDGVGRLVKAGHQIVIEAGAGTAAGFTDDAYSAAGATLAADAELFAGAQLVAAVQPASLPVERLPGGAVLIGFLNPGSDGAVLGRLAAQGITAFAMELVPRTTRAQSMDALSSQATVAGYKAVLLGAAALPRFLPMLTTAAGSIPPARVFVVGAGVAGLQAIATARRLGAIVSAFDVRPVVKEQVQSLGATFVEVQAVAAEGAGGYAKELAADQQRLVAEAVAKHVRDMDLVVTTAQIPGRPAPRIISEAMVRSMKPGSVIVDLAAESGGNCELTRAGETVSAHGVTILGPANLAATLPFHASQMYSRNVQSFIEYATRDGALAVDLADPIIGPTCVVHGGAVRGAQDA